MPLSNYSIDTFVSPHFSSLTSSDAPDIKGCTKEYGNWVNNFILNSIFRVRLKEPYRQLIFFFLQKVEGALQEYHDGRDLLAVCLQKRNESISEYLHSLRHFELAASLAYQAYDTLRTMVQENLFTQEDGSPLQRMNRLQNISKHANKELWRGDIPDNLSAPIWLTNSGIESHDTNLSFTEFAELLQDLAKLAEILSNPPINKEG